MIFLPWSLNVATFLVKLSIPKRTPLLSDKVFMFTFDSRISCLANHSRPFWIETDQIFWEYFYLFGSRSKKWTCNHFKCGQFKGGAWIDQTVDKVNGVNLQCHGYKFQVFPGKKVDSQDSWTCSVWVL